jgi:murein DD-endopeptidase MepM/ murein hydrolase activator NlpD
MKMIDFCVMKRYVLLLGLCYCSLGMLAQFFFPSKTYPTTDFINPLKIPFSLVGNFGECRPNHFHSGIDIRTDGKENLRVHAIADGYVSRIRIDKDGFGNAIFITHKNGFTSLYAHLNKFFPALETFIRQKQYESQSWEIDIRLMPWFFLVKQGKYIALSGNTGHSSGPHLHLEIRNTKTEIPLNGLLFYNDIKDMKNPAIKQLAVYDGCKSIYEQSPTLFTTTQNGHEAILQPSIIKINSSSAFFGIQAADYMEIAKGILGVYEMHLYVDDKPFFAWQLDDISYNITRYMNALADYKIIKKKGPWIQLCRQLPNDKLPIYKSFSASKGVIDLGDGLVKKIRIEVFDTKGNKSQMHFLMQGLKMNENNDCKQKMRAGKVNAIRTNDLNIYIPADALYDDICFTSSIVACDNMYSWVYQIHSSDVPLHSAMCVSFLPKKYIPQPLRSKIALVKTQVASSNERHGKAVCYFFGKVFSTVKEFGAYEIVIDTTPPSIESVVKNSSVVSDLKKIDFTIREETTSVKKVVATLDGHWIRLSQKGHVYTYDMDEYFPKGTHELKLAASDENQNTKIVTYTLTR